MSSEMYNTQSDRASSEVTYPQDDLDPGDVEDIIERLHIGTLRREELKRARKSLMEASGDDKPIDEKELEDFYKTDSPYKSEKKNIKRHSSQTSNTSTGSGTSGSSGDRRTSRHSSTSTMVESHDQGIQTTIGRSFRQEGIKIATDNEPNTEPVKRERKLSTKDKMKRLFKRKSSSNDDNNGNSMSIELIPELPQTFLVKYMGKRPTKGLWGSKHTRDQVEEIVDNVGKMPKGEDLPLVLFQVNNEGLMMKPHRKNKVATFKPVSIPIQYISYGLQDTVYPRIFCFIMVKEMSSQSKKLECHVYACDSSKSARKLAAALALAFQSYSEALEGGSFKFTIDVPIRAEDTQSCYEA